MTIGISSLIAVMTTLAALALPIPLADQHKKFSYADVK